MTTELTEKERREGKKTEEIMFKCKICGQVKPLSQLRELRRFFPVLMACAGCDDKMSGSGRTVRAG